MPCFSWSFCDFRWVRAKIKSLGRAVDSYLGTGIVHLSFRRERDDKGIRAVAFVSDLQVAWNGRSEEFLEFAPVIQRTVLCRVLFLKPQRPALMESRSSGDESCIPDFINQSSIADL